MGSSYGVGNTGLSNFVECFHGVALVSGLGRMGLLSGLSKRVGNEKMGGQGKHCIALGWVIIINSVRNSYCSLMGRCCEALSLLVASPSSGIMVTLVFWRI